MKVEMQIEDVYGRVVAQDRSNKASKQVVKEMYMCPTTESDGADQNMTESGTVELHNSFMNSFTVQPKQPIDFGYI